jgi:hypothetical protein
MRTEREIIIDRLLLLYAVDRANKYGSIDIFKLQKIPFASELEMNNRKLKGFNYTFFRFTHGPMTKEIYEDGGVLHTAGLISTLKEPIKLAERGQRVFDSLGSLYEENHRIVSYIDSAAELYAPLSFGQVKRKIYGLTVEWSGEEWQVGDLPEHVDVLAKLKGDEAQEEFKLDDDWIDSVWGTFNYSKDETAKLKVVHRVAS